MSLFADTLSVVGVSVADSLREDSLQSVWFSPYQGQGVDVTVVDSLPLFYQDQFITQDTIKLTPYHSRREFASGQEGVPLPYSPRTDSGISFILLVCLLLSSFALARSKKFLSQLVKDFVLHRERTSIFATSTAGDVRFLLLLVLQTCILGGIYIFNYFNDSQPALMVNVPPYLLLGVYTGCCLVYLLVKWLLYSFLGWIFFDKEKTSLWLESYSALIYYIGFALFPFVLLLVYFDLKISLLIAIGLLLAIFTKILMLYKWIKLFFSNLNGLFLLILYFCALEIMPCFIVWRGLIEINNNLVLKF